MMRNLKMDLGVRWRQKFICTDTSAILRLQVKYLRIHSLHIDKSKVLPVALVVAVVVVTVVILVVVVEEVVVVAVVVPYAAAAAAA